VATEFLSENDLPEWDAFVARHPLGLVYHLSSWKQALERAFSHIKGHFLALRDGSGNIVAGIPVYVVRSWLFGNRLVSIPYASICDPLILSKEQYHQLMPGLTSLQNSTKSHSIRIKARKAADMVISSGGPINASLYHHYIPLNQSPELLLKSISKSSIERVIRRSIRNGIGVVIQSDQSALRMFYKLSVNSRRRLGLPPLPYPFIYSLYQSFNPANMKLFFADQQRQIIGALLALEFNGFLHLEYSGAISGTFDSGASRLLCWEAINYAYSKGYKYVSFGCTDSWNNGLLDYKRRWATVEEPIHQIGANGKNVPLIGQTAKQYSACRWILSHSPNAFCDALARLFYRHHG
jgi:hypothetical protein